MNYNMTKCFYLCKHLVCLLSDSAVESELFFEGIRYLFSLVLKVPFIICNCFVLSMKRFHLPTQCLLRIISSPLFINFALLEQTEVQKTH